MHGGNCNARCVPDPQGCIKNYVLKMNESSNLASNFFHLATPSALPTCVIGAAMVRVTSSTFELPFSFLIFKQMLDRN